MTRGPHFVSGDPTRAGIEVDPAGRGGGVFVAVTDYPDGSAHILDRAETTRLRDWLTEHLNRASDNL